MPSPKLSQLIGRAVTSSPSNSGANLKAALVQEAFRLGFDDVRITAAVVPESTSSQFDEFIAGGYYGDMTWMAAKADRRRQPKALWPEVKTVITLAVNYGPDHDPRLLLEQKDRGSISVYAQGRDYHDVLKKRLKALARWLVDASDAEVKVFVDTAPVLEKPLAAAAGLGWQGKHTNLVSRTYGSWLFLGEVFTTALLPSDTPETDHCGTCRQCLDVCPTQAFLDANRIDARRCISYLTIEHKGHIARDLRPMMGNRIYGCDDCLAVCPWNKFAEISRESTLKARQELEAPKLTDLAMLSDSTFRELFRGSPIKRIGRDRFVRNVLIAIGNSGLSDLVIVIKPLCQDDSPLVRAMAIWALSKLSSDQAAIQKRSLFEDELDPDVRAEWASI
jgi:epoxyqueuosine reductase